MKKSIVTVLIASILAAGLPAAAYGKPAARQPAGVAAPRWDRTIAITPDGFPVMGNPDAPVKVIEFISYTCSHCADFAKESKVPLSAGLVRQGKVSVELRPYLRNSIDEVPSLLALCGPRSQYFANSAAILAAQTTWFKPPGDPGYEARWHSLEAKPAEQRRMMAKDLGLTKLMLARGYTSAALEACLNDQTKRDWLQKQTDYAETTIGVIGTPSFLINGVLQDVYGWVELAPRISAALAAGPRAAAVTPASPVAARPK